MKSFICFIFLSFLSFDTIVLNANNCLPLENATLSLEEKVAYEKYRVTARTRNSYGENYWVDLVVEGQVSSLGNTIYRVYYNDGYGLKSLTYMMEYGYDNTYYVYLDGNNYYFEF